MFRSQHPPTWQGYMAQDLQQPQDHSVAAYDDLSWSIPKFGRYEEFEPGPFQKGFTPTAYEQTGWETRDSDWANELPMWWADDSTLVDTVQWFDQPPLYRSPAFPREWEDSDSYGHELRPTAFSDFKDPRAQQHIHERACGPMMRRRITCMAQASTNPYKSCIRWIDAEARCFQSIFCKKELVEFEACTEGGDPALGPLCAEYQAALNNCMSMIELFWSKQRVSYWYPDDDLDLEPQPGGIEAKDFDHKHLRNFEGNYEPDEEPFHPTEEWLDTEYDAMDDEYSELEDEYFTEDWEDVEEYDEEYEHDEGERYEYLSAHEEELEGDELDDPDQETEDGDDRDDDLIEEQGDDHWAGGSSFEEDLPDQPEEYRHKLHNTSEWPPKRSFEKRIDAAETYDPDSPGSQYFPIPVREPDGSWEEEQYEIRRAKKEFQQAAWRNHGQESFGHVYVQRELRR